MAIKLTTTREAAQTNGVKCLVYGKAGRGKTRLCATAPNPLVISAESGLLSLRDFDIPVVQVENFQDLMDVYQAITEDPAYAQFETICLDSISEIAECVLNAEKKASKDPRAAYGILAEKMTDLIRAFRDLPGKHVYFTAKQEMVKDDTTGISMYGPSMPGRTMTMQLPYFFDEVFKYEIGVTSEGVEYGYLQTRPTIQSDAKDRSGVLDAMEEPDLSKIFAKILNGGTQNGST